VYELVLGTQGFGNWTGIVGDSGGRLAIYGGDTQSSIEIGVSADGEYSTLWQHTRRMWFIDLNRTAPLHEVLSALLVSLNSLRAV
jgi:hypothetical protein